MGRDYLFDNMKAFLIFFVVFAHYISTSATFELKTFGGILYIISFSFIMQGFLFVAGYFSKNEDKCRKSAFKAFLLPYLVLMPIMYLVRYMLYGTATFDLTKPTMALWYLLAMFVYKFMIKDLAKIKYILPFSFIVSLLAGFIPFLGAPLALGRIFGFLPFFLLGYFCKKEDLNRIRRIPKPVGVGAGILLIIFSLLIVYYQAIPISAFYFKRAYVYSGLTNMEGVGIRVVLMILAMSWIAVFLILMPEKKTSYVTIGQHTLSVFILHIFIRYFFMANGTFNGQGWLTYLMIFLAALISVWLFSRPLVGKMYNSCIDFFLFRRWFQ